MKPLRSKTISEARSKTLDIKEYRTFKYTDKRCRICWLADETLNHIVNCGEEEHISDVESTVMEACDIKSLNKIADRILMFLETADAIE